MASGDYFKGLTGASTSRSSHSNGLYLAILAISVFCLKRLFWLAEIRYQKISISKRLFGVE
jgi:hypothetical protein